MGVKANGSGEPQLVWRVTPEQPNGELLELVPMEVPAPGRKSSRQVSPAPPDGPLGAQRLVVASPAPEAAARVTTSATRQDHTTSWRASSWDLLNGLVVRDVSDKIPRRTFDALFSANEDTAHAPGRKQR
jgi:hypothetical protein